MSYIPDMQILTRVAAWRIYTTRIFSSYLPLSYTYDKHISFLFAIVVYIRQAYFLPICHCRIHTTSIFPSYLPMSYAYDMRFSFLFANVVYIRHNRSLSAILDKIHLARNFYWLVCGARSICIFFNVGYIRHWQNKKTIFLKADFSAIEFPFFLNTSASRVKICMSYLSDIGK